MKPVALALGLVLAACAHAPVPPPAGAPAPAAPAANLAPAHASPFAGYRAFTAEEPRKGWREANDEVRDAGGHVGLMKENAKP